MTPLLSATTLTVQALNTNHISTPTPITTLDNTSLSLTGGLGVGRATLVISGNSTVTANRIGGAGMTGISSADWGQVTIQDTANVTATNGIVGDTTAWGLDLNGGTLTTKSINYGPHSYNGTTNLNFNGTLVKANQDNANFITSFNGVGSEIKAGGAKIDTNGFDIGIQVPLVGSGALTKSGTGKLTLSEASTYTGKTSVVAGTLALAQAFLNDTADVELTTGATLQLDFAGTDTIDELLIDGLPQASGTWGRIGHPTAQNTSSNNNNKNNNKDTMKPNTTLRNLLLPAILMSVGMSNAATIIPLSGAVADSTLDPSRSAANLLNDSFAYDPVNPTLVLPDQNDPAGWHANGAERFVVSLASAFTTAAGSETIYFDLYGRSSTNPVVLVRDNNYTVRLRNGLTQVAEATLQGVPDTAPFFNRTTFNLGTGVTFDNIEFVNSGTDGYVMVMEVRAASVPEPSAALLGGLGLLGLLGLLRRRR